MIANTIQSAFAMHSVATKRFGNACIIALSLFAITFPSVVLAKEYEVEIIVFQHTGADTSENEIWGESPLHTADIAKQALQATENSEQGGVVDLLEKKLNSLAQQLKSSPNYKLLDHRGWQQSLLSKASTSPSPIGNKPVSSSDPTLLGSVKVYGGQFIVAELALLLRPGGSSQTLSQDTSGFGSYVRTAQYSLLEKRRIKLNEIHYFDHPLFGAIVQIRPL
ncbi:MAG: peptidoglycan binding protein CsiV [Gammaproteobacteria bacterium]|nr:peptidoglycan binding protein CsiV [Gammaproteobacteria bacterium]